MKQSKLVLVFCMAMASAPAAHASAPLSWARSKAQAGLQSVSNVLPQWPQNAVRVVKKKYIDKQALNGQEQRILNQLKGGTIVAIVTALLAGTAYVASREQLEDQPIQVAVSSGTTATNVGEILAKWNVKLEQDDSIPALFIKAVTNGAGWMVNSLYDLVPKNVLQAGYEIAANRAKSAASIYAPIRESLQRALVTFEESQFRKNIRFIYAAVTGLADEIRENICVDRMTPTKNAITEALQRIKSKTSKTFQSIKGFLQNPDCSN